MTHRWLRTLAAIAAVTAVLLVAWLIIRVTTGTGEDATELVRESGMALEQTSVRGTVVTTVRTPDGEREVRAEMHRGEGRFSMRILSGRGEGSEVHRQQGAVWVKRPSGQISRRADIGDPTMQPELMARNWEFVSAGIRRVAGRITTLVRGSGPGGSVTLAIDRATGFPLHISRRDPRGELVSETTWLEADFSVAAPPLMAAPPEAEGPQRRALALEEARAAVDFTVLEPGWVPEGWQLQGWFLHGRADRQMVQVRFSDGLRPMVIIQRDAAQAAGPRGGEGERHGWERRPRDQQPPEGERRRQPQADERQRPEGEARRQPEHLRGAGSDASRREIAGTMVFVVGPLSREQRERVLDSMKAP